jgi:uncharacterized membrane protein
MSKKRRPKQARTARRTVMYAYDDGYGDYLKFSFAVQFTIALYLMSMLCVSYANQGQILFLVLQAVMIAMFFAGQAIVIFRFKRYRFRGEVEYRKHLRAAITVAQASLLLSAILIPNSLIVIQPLKSFLMRWGIGPMLINWLVVVLRIVISGIIGNFAYDAIKKLVKNWRDSARTSVS